MNVTLINGGRGAASFIAELKKIKNCKIFSIVNAYDDGKSTGLLRDFFNILGPSDIRKVHSLLLDNSHPNYNVYKKFFEYRFPANISNKEAKLKIIDIINSKKNEIITFDKFKNEKKLIIIKYLNFFLNELLKKETKRKLLFNFKDC